MRITRIFLLPKPVKIQPITVTTVPVNSPNERIHVPQEQQKHPDTNETNLSGDELDQVRELLFGGTIREIERQREALKNDVNVSFDEADQMTNRRLDDVMRRLDGLHQELARTKEAQNNIGIAETQRIDSTLVRLASEQSSSLAKESQRIDQHIASETKRLDEHIASEAHRIDELINRETSRIDQALATETNRIDKALDALHRQMKSDNMHHIDSLRRSVATERNRLSQSMRLLADGMLEDPEEPKQ